MHIAHSRSRVLAAVFIVLALTASAFAGDGGQVLSGKWKMTVPARDAAGSPCPFVPDMMEFFDDGTVAMSNMPGNRVPFKTDLAPDEKQAMELRNPSLKGKNLLLVKPMPQMEWRSTPIVYAYSVTANELTISVTGWTPATFTRVK